MFFFSKIEISDVFVFVCPSLLQYLDYFKAVMFLDDFIDSVKNKAKLKKLEDAPL